MIPDRPGTSTGPANAPILALADLHGHPDLFDAAVERGREIAGRGDITIVNLGDYLDNGPSIRALLDRVITFDQEHPGKFLPIIGNHDLACVLSLSHPRGAEAQEAWFARWRARYANGLHQWTPSQYGTTTLEEFREAFPPAHLAWLKSLPWYRRVGGYVLIHAGLSPGPLAPQLAELDRREIADLPVGHLPPALRDRSLATTFDPTWDAIVVSGHSKDPGGLGLDFVAPNRVTLHSAACRGEGLHCVLLPGVAALGKRPVGTFFSIQASHTYMEKE